MPERINQPPSDRIVQQYLEKSNEQIRLAQLSTNPNVVQSLRDSARRNQDVAEVLKSPGTHLAWFRARIAQTLLQDAIEIDSEIQGGIYTKDVDIAIKDMEERLKAAARILDIEGNSSK